LRVLIKRLEDQEPFDAQSLDLLYNGLAAELGLKLVDLAQLTRLALTGRSASPPVFQVMALLGKPETLTRLKAAQAVIEEKRKER